MSCSVSVGLVLGILITSPSGIVVGLPSSASVGALSYSFTLLEALVGSSMSVLVFSKASRVCSSGGLSLDSGYAGIV